MSERLDLESNNVISKAIIKRSKEKFASGVRTSKKDIARAAIPLKELAITEDEFLLSHYVDGSITTILQKPKNGRLRCRIVHTEDLGAAAEPIVKWHRGHSKPYACVIAEDEVKS